MKSVRVYMNSVFTSKHVQLQGRKLFTNLEAEDLGLVGFVTKGFGTGLDNTIFSSNCFNILQIDLKYKTYDTKST